MMKTMFGWGLTTLAKLKRAKAAPIERAPAA